MVDIRCSVPRGICSRLMICLMCSLEWMLFNKLHNVIMVVRERSGAILQRIHYTLEMHIIITICTSISGRSRILLKLMNYS
jgi:hypothetical protein